MVNRILFNLKILTNFHLSLFINCLIKLAFCHSRRWTQMHAEKSAEKISITILKSPIYHSIKKLDKINANTNQLINKIHCIVIV